jgi:hypothetical protein
MLREQLHLPQHRAHRRKEPTLVRFIAIPFVFTIAGVERIGAKRQTLRSVRRRLGIEDNCGIRERAFLRL